MNRTVLGIILCLVAVALASPTKSPVSTVSTTDSNDTHHHRSDTEQGTSLNHASVTLLLAVYLGSYTYCIVCCLIDCLCPMCCMDIKEEKYTKQELAERKCAQAKGNPTITSTGRPSSSMKKGSSSSASQGGSKLPSKLASSHRNKKKMLKKRI
ncbi:hypothetical protein TYRP_019159 [Tyrophagus putrescentiae]|nr:hypothetical protein TYRP_019159 [Tyrophagus putrescentiae]